MRIEVGRWVGFCSGVQRAIRGIDETLETNRVVYCLGEIIHNPRVVAGLQRKGMVVVNRIDEIPRPAHFVIRSHGLPAEVVRAAQERDLRIHDFTCPKVKNTHRLVSDLRKENYRIIVVGNRLHPEVKSILSLSGPGTPVVEGVREAQRIPAYEKIAVVVQTTFDPLSFSSIVSALVLGSKKALVCNTLCEETIKRQKEAADMALRVDFMVVVGGKNSSNTKTLCHIVKDTVEVAHIEDADELETVDLSGARVVGLLSGASTPVEEVERVQKRLAGK
jgi:(E)-4-hydroxy-3-methyl-but-2-enyl pyrophosphate reductase